MLSVEELEEQVRSGEIETIVVGFTDLYGRLVGKRYDPEFFLESVVSHGSHACDYLLTVDMNMEPVPGYRFATWEKGYGDVHLVPDFSSLRRASWLDKTAFVLCDVYDGKTHERVPMAPRSLLRTQVERANALGFEVMAASELEYYLYEGSFREANEADYRNLKPAGWVIEDYHLLQGTREEPFTAAARRHLRDSGVPVENSKGEWGLGQHELNVRYTNALAMADRHVVYKQCLKEVAMQQGRSVTFMAKVDEDQAGSSCHVHLSLWRDGQNAFAGKTAFGPVQGSEVFGQVLAGWLRYAPELMPCLAPTVNSYKRYQAGSWAPTRLAWSFDNRTAGFRVVGEGPSLRIECRVPGADANPYLAFAALLAAGLAGIEEGLEPPPMFEGDVYQAGELPTMPTSLRDATDTFEASAVAKAAFGEESVEHLTHFFRTEQAAYDRAVTDWERRRYFEQI
ncbi:MAG: glutamine synthetase [Planctomycetes bacterium]|nr:glutamine synthetase [Planctomycetota bacterium]